MVQIRGAIALSLCLLVACGGQAGSTRGAPLATLVHDVTLPIAPSGFEGLSAIEMSEDGGSALILSDRGRAFAVALERSDGLSVRAISPAFDMPPDTDLEGLAQHPDGQFYTSTEGPAGVYLISDDNRAAALPTHPSFAGIANNRAFEALAIDKSGVLYTLPERPTSGTSLFPLYAFEGGAWRVEAQLPQSQGMMAVGADFGQDGLLYLLERGIGWQGFTSQVRRFDLRQPERKPELVLRTQPGTHGNLEGLSLWQNAAGATILTMVADNNFLSLQRSHLVEYQLRAD